MGAFNDIAIKRYDKDRVSDGNHIGVGFLYMPKQRVIEDILNKSRQIPLPAISISIASISRDAERVFNKIDGHIIGTTKDADIMRKIPQPVPINIGVNMSIIARYQTDAEQILSNFAPYCDPYIAVSWKVPTTENTSYEKEIRTIIEWSGTVNTTYPIELSSNQLARVTYDTTFTIKGWLFKEIDSYASKIYQINSNFIPTDLGEECLVFNNTLDTIERYNTSNYPERLVQNARPTLKNIDCPNYYINQTDTNFIYNLYGKDFFNITDMYLTTADPLMFTDYQFHDPFVDTKRHSTYPGFWGKKISTFKVNSLTNIEFTIPDNITTPGVFDIIVKNEAGYSVLSTDSYLPHSPTYQPPCTNGIHVISL